MIRVFGEPKSTSNQLTIFILINPFEHKAQFHLVFMKVSHKLLHIKFPILIAITDTNKFLKSKCNSYIIGYLFWAI